MFSSTFFNLNCCATIQRMQHMNWHWIYSLSQAYYQDFYYAHLAQYEMQST